MNTDQDQVEQLIKERFSKLPVVVQKAIKSADVEKHLRSLADTHKLHLDQWQLLENQVIMTLLGFQPAAELERHIKAEVRVDDDTARILASDIALSVFDPIRKEIEHALQELEAVDEESQKDEKSAQQNQIPSNPIQGGGDVYPSHSSVTQQEPEQKDEAVRSPQPSTTQQASNEQGNETTPQQEPAQEAVRMERTPAPAAYKSGIASTERRVIEGDPYREPVD